MKIPMPSLTTRLAAVVWPVRAHTLYSLASRGFTAQTEAEYQARRPPPFPYKTHNYNAFWAAIDGTLQRWDDNTKLVVIEGLPGAGKSTFARQLATATGLKLFSEVTLDMLYINDYGFDRRRIQRHLPGHGVDFPDVRCFDWPDIWRAPNDRPACAKFLKRLMFLRMVQYRDALDHLYHTGQGCIIDQSFFGDFVNVDAFEQMGYLSHEARDVLTHTRFACVSDSDYLNYPHLVVYLDVAPEVCLDRIKKRHVPNEVNSPMYQNADYLKAIESAYKDKFFIDMERFSRVVVYDWTNFGDVQWVCDDLEKFDLEYHKEDFYMFRDWYYHNDNMLCRRRRELPHREKMYTIFPPYYFETDDLNMDPNQQLAYERALEQCPGERYAPGYNADMNDRNLLFKTKLRQLRYINDKLPLLLEKRAAMDRVLDDPANQATIKKRAIDLVEKELFREPLDHY